RLDAGDFAASQEVIVLPASRLMVAAEQLRRLRLGVSDPSGRVQAALAAEGAAFENLETDAQELFFDGGAVILAGRGRTQALAAACERFRHRLRRGMTVLVLNPPAEWAAEGVRRVEQARPPTGPAWASKALHDLPLPDMGSGPWASALAADKAQTLLWAGADAEGAVRPGEACGLALWRPVGEGRLAAAMLPALADPAADAVGRCVLDELVLWVLETQLPHRQGEQHLN
ncbi:MAG: hypothetical protein NTU94_18580, partial [Planctomycetota bacterium]|nr:hypothetical protein [Planctomycetota bacterium]